MLQKVKLTYKPDMLYFGFTDNNYYCCRKRNKHPNPTCSTLGLLTTITDVAESEINIHTWHTFGLLTTITDVAENEINTRPYMSYFGSTDINFWCCRKRNENTNPTLSTLGLLTRIIVIYACVQCIGMKFLSLCFRITYTNEWLVGCLRTVWLWF